MIKIKSNRRRGAQTQQNTRNDDENPLDTKESLKDVLDGVRAQVGKHINHNKKFKIKNGFAEEPAAVVDYDRVDSVMAFSPIARNSSVDAFSNRDNANKPTIVSPIHQIHSGNLSNYNSNAASIWNDCYQ